MYWVSATCQALCGGFTSVPIVTLWGWSNHHPQPVRGWECFAASRWWRMELGLELGTTIQVRSLAEVGAPGSEQKLHKYSALVFLGFLFFSVPPELAIMKGRITSKVVTGQFKCVYSPHLPPPQIFIKHLLYRMLSAGWKRQMDPCLCEAYSPGLLCPNGSHQPRVALDHVNCGPWAGGVDS